jgi:hypothetical protein
MLVGEINKYELHGNFKVHESNYVYFHDGWVIYDVVIISICGSNSPSPQVVDREDSLQQTAEY